MLAATLGSTCSHNQELTGCRSSKAEVAGRNERPRDGSGQHAREAQPDRQRSREAQPDQERTHESSPARERAADRAVKRELTTMTEATHPAVGEKRQVGRGALAWTAPAPAACEIISCWALVVAFRQQSKQSICCIHAGSLA